MFDLSLFPQRQAKNVGQQLEHDVLRVDQDLQDVQNPRLQEGEHFDLSGRVSRSVADGRHLRREGRTNFVRIQRVSQDGQVQTMERRTGMHQSGYFLTALENEF